MRIFSYAQFTLALDDPVVVVRGEPFPDVKWGPWQFPSLARISDGRILCTWSVGADAIDSYEVAKGNRRPRAAVSEDGGATWTITDEAPPTRGIPYRNGKEYLGAEAKNAAPAPWTATLAPAYRSPDGRLSLYRAEDVPGFSPCFTAKERDPATGEITPFPARVCWPHHAVRVCRQGGQELVYPLQTTMGIMGKAIPDGEGGLFFATYAEGFSAATGAPPSRTNTTSTYCTPATAAGRGSGSPRF